LRYSPGLDGLRALAILVVMIFHANPNVVSGGYVGVDLFFVLSAFLITSILAEEYRASGSIDLPRFYVRRFLRLGPALLLMLAVYLLLAPFAWPGDDHGRDALVTALYLSDFTVAAGIGPDYLSHSWSLALEEQFYLLWPFLLVPLLRSSRPTIWLIAAWVAMVAWRFSFTDWRIFYYRPDAHGTGLLAGALLYFSGWRASRWVGLLGLALFVTVCLSVEIKWSAGSIIAAELAAVMMIASVSNTKWVETPMLVHLGKLSYGLYLWHYPIALYLRTRYDFFVSTSLLLPLTYAMALLSYHTVEAWGRQAKDRLSAKAAQRAVLSGCARVEPSPDDSTRTSALRF
jgi:peptidoglycan/LPS O-acetylase OafA/YrhL